MICVGEALALCRNSKWGEQVVGSCRTMERVQMAWEGDNRCTGHAGEGKPFAKENKLEQAMHAGPGASWLAWPACWLVLGPGLYVVLGCFGSKKEGPMGPKSIVIKCK